MLNNMFFPGGYRSGILTSLFAGPATVNTLSPVNNAALGWLLGPVDSSTPKTTLPEGLEKILNSPATTVNEMFKDSPLGWVFGLGSTSGQNNELDGKLDGMVSSSAASAGSNISRLVSQSNLMGTLQIDGAGSFNSVFAMLAGTGTFGSMLDAVVGGGEQAKSQLDTSITGILNGGGSPMSKGVYEGLNSGGMPSELDPDSAMGKIVGDVFSKAKQKGILSVSFASLSTDAPTGTFQSSLLSSSAGKAEVLGGTSKVLKQLFAGWGGKKA